MLERGVFYRNPLSKQFDQEEKDWDEKSSDSQTQ